VIVAALFAVVKMLMGGPPPKQPPAAVPDAQVAHQPPVDAAPPAPPDAPSYDIVEMQIVSDPPGATVFMDGVKQKGVTPMKVRAVKNNKDIKFIAQKDGYNDWSFDYNPVVYEKGEPIMIRLQKPPKGTPIQHKPITPGAGTGSDGHSKSGEFGGNPFLGSGTVPKR